MVMPLSAVQILHMSIDVYDLDFTALSVVISFLVVLPKAYSEDTLSNTTTKDTAMMVRVERVMAMISWLL